MKKRMRTRKSLNVKKRVVGFFAIAVILLGVIGGFGLTHVVAESNSTTGGGADRSAPVAVVASKSEDTSVLPGGGGSNAKLITSMMLQHQSKSPTINSGLESLSELSS